MDFPYLQFTVVHKDGDRHVPVINTNQQFRAVYQEAKKQINKVNATPQLFVHAGQVVQLSIEEGQPSLIPVTRDQMRIILCADADWIAVTDKGASISQPSGALLGALLSTGEDYLPPLEGVYTHPVYTDDWTLIDTPGYHENAKVYLQNNSHSFDIAMPVNQARDILLEAIEDFPFADEASRAHALALMVLPFIRPALGMNPTPLHMVYSPTPGTGKGKLVDLVATIATGTPTRPTLLSRSSEENRKKFTALLNQGQSIIHLDNIPPERVLNDPALASVMTTTQPIDRSLGHSKMRKLTNMAVWVATGNNLQYTMELARRTVTIRLDAHCEAPWLRNDFRYPDLLGWAKTQQAQLASAALSLIQHWINEGQPKAEHTLLGSFETWSTTLGGILHAASVPGFLENLEDIYTQADTETEDWKILCTHWWNQYGTQAITTTMVCNLCHEHQLLEEVIGFGNARSQVSKLGRALRQHENRVFNGLKLNQEEGVQRSAARYTLCRVAAPAVVETSPTDNKEKVYQG